MLSQVNCNLSRIYLRLVDLPTENPYCRGQIPIQTGTEVQTRERVVGPVDA